MIRLSRIFLALLLFASSLAACSSIQPALLPDTPFPAGPTPTHWTPPLAASWQIQFAGKTDMFLPVDIYALDLFDIPPETIAVLHGRGIKVICYFSYTG